ncbi:hypothetical protein EDD16DRAFT_1656890 [Pisolithus croceorrhizus]|nr:hypothetical protein EDD16DRAFT_1656890 [Pisolithus croceorrhizus]
MFLGVLGLRFRATSAESEVPTDDTGELDLELSRRFFHRCINCSRRADRTARRTPTAGGCSWLPKKRNARSA